MRALSSAVLGWLVLVIAAGLALGSGLGCGGNPYGYTPEYVPLSEEEPYGERGMALAYEDVRRDPLKHKHQLVAWFGVVKDVQPVPGKDQVRVALDLRFHQERHL